LRFWVRPFAVSVGVLVTLFFLPILKKWIHTCIRASDAIKIKRNPFLSFPYADFNLTRKPLAGSVRKFNQKFVNIVFVCVLDDFQHSSSLLLVHPFSIFHTAMMNAIVNTA